MDSALYSV